MAVTAEPLPIREVELRPALLERHNVVGERRALCAARFADRVAREHGRAPLAVVRIVAPLRGRPAGPLVRLLMLALVHGTAGLAPFDECGAARFTTGVPHGSGLPRIRFSGNSYLRPRVRSSAAAKGRGGPKTF